MTDTIEKTESPLSGSEQHHKQLRLSPLGLITNTLSNIRNLILPIIAVLYASFSKNEISILNIGWPLLLIFTIASIHAYLIWRRFSYQIKTEEISIKSGLFSRNTRSIPYERIQDVSVEQNIIARLLGIAEVKFETGGGKGDEGLLQYVTLDQAEKLRQLVRERKSSNAVNNIPSGIITETLKEPQKEHIIFTMDIKRIFTLGMFSFSLVIFAIAAGAIQQFDFLLPGDVGDLIDYIVNLFDERSADIKSISIASQVIAIISLLFGLIIIGILSGQLQVFLREYGFILTDTERGIRRRRGLLTLTDVIMPLHRVQAAIVQTGAIRKRFGWYALKFTSLGSDTGNESSHMIAPLAKYNEFWPIAKRANIIPPNDSQIFSRPHISYVTPTLMWLSLFITATTVLILNPALIISYENLSKAPAIWLIAAIIICIFILNNLVSWRFHLHALDDKQVYVKSGFWNQKMTILPLIKTQSVDIVQGPLSQYWRVADVKFGIAGGSGLSTLTIHNIPINLAHEIRNKSISNAKEVDFSALIKAP